MSSEVFSSNVTVSNDINYVTIVYLLNSDPQQLKDKYSLRDLKRFGILPIDIKNVGYTVNQYYNALYEARDMLNANYTIQQLRDGGYTTKEMKVSEVSVDKLFNIYTYQEIRNGGYTAKELKDSNSAIINLKIGGYSAKELKEAGYELTDIKSIDYTPKDSYEAGYSALQLKNAGYLIDDIVNLGYTASELYGIGATSIQLINAGYSYQNLIDAGYTNAIIDYNLTLPNYTGIQYNILTNSNHFSTSTFTLPISCYLVSANINTPNGIDNSINLELYKNDETYVSKLLFSSGVLNLGDEANYSIFSSYDNSITLKNNQEYYFTPNGEGSFGVRNNQTVLFNPIKLRVFLKDSGYNVFDLLNFGFSIKALRDSGFTAQEILQYTTIEQLSNAGYTTTDLLNSGLSVIDLINNNVNITDIFTPQQLVTEYGVTPSQLLLGGFTKDDLKNLGYASRNIILYDDLNLANTTINGNGESHSFTTDNTLVLDGIAMITDNGANGFITLIEDNNKTYNSDTRSNTVMNNSVTGAQVLWKFTNTILKQGKTYKVSTAFRYAYVKNNQLKFAVKVFGIIYEDLKLLKSNGVSVSDLVNLGFNLKDIIELGNYSIQDCFNSGITVSQLKKFVPLALLGTAYSVQNLKDELYKALDILLETNYSESDLQGIFTQNEIDIATTILNDSSKSITYFASNTSYNALELRNAAFTLKQIYNAGISIGNITNYTLEELKNANIPISQLKPFFKPNILLDIGYAFSQLENAGYVSNTLTFNDQGFIPKLHYQFTNTDDRIVYRVYDDALVSFKTEVLKPDVFYVVNKPSSTFKFFLKDMNLTARQALDLGFTLNQLYSFNIYNVSDFKSANITVLELRNLGYTIQQIYDARYSLSELKSAFSVLEVYTVSNASKNDLLNAGYTDYELSHLYNQVDLSTNKLSSIQVFDTEDTYGQYTDSNLISNWNNYQQPNNNNKPVYFPDGGINNTSYIKFTRSSSQFLDGGSKTLNINSNGGITIVALVKFSNIGFNETIIDFGNGQQNNNIVLRRNASTNDLSFLIYEGSSKVFELIGSNIIEKDVWHVYSVRYNNITYLREIFIDGILVNSSSSLVIDVTDKIISKSYVGRSNWTSYSYLEGCIGGLYLFDKVLPENDITQLTYYLIYGSKFTDINLFSGQSILVPNNVVYLNSEFSKWNSFRNYLDTTVPSIFSSGGHQNLQYVNFNRTDCQYLNGGQKTFNIDTNGGFTIISFVKFSNDIGNNEKIIDYGNDNMNNNIILGRNGSTNILNFSIYENSTRIINLSTLDNTIVNNSWVVYAIKYTQNNKKAQIFVNGIEVAATVSITPMTNKTLSNTYIGRSSVSTDSYFKGDIGNLYVYDKPINDLDIQNMSTYLLGGSINTQFKLSGSGSIFYVDSKSSWDNYKVIQEINIPSYNNTGLNNLLSVNFNRTNSNYFNGGPKNINISTNGGLTIFALAKFTGTPANNEKIIDFGTSNSNNNIILGRNGTSSNLIFSLYENSNLALNLIGTSLIQQNVWHVYIIRYNSSTKLLEMFRDGILYASTTGTLDISNKKILNSFIGKSNWSTDSYFNGSLGGLYVYDSYLSDQNIVQMSFHLLYNSPINANTVGKTIDSSTSLLFLHPSQISLSNLYFSTNYGINWSISKKLYDIYPDRFLSSKDGNYFLATIGNSIYVYNNGIWSTPLTGKNWHSIAISDNGKYMAAAVTFSGWNGTEGLWFSNDYGSTWSKKSTAGSGRVVVMSSSGQYIVVAANYSSMYLSIDYGVTWSNIYNRTGELLGVGENNPNKLAISKNGKYIVAAHKDDGQNPGKLSTNYGVTWSNFTFPSGGPKSMVISDDGNTFVATCNDNITYVSYNLGQNWFKILFVPLFNLNISSFSKAISGIYNNIVYVIKSNVNTLIEFGYSIDQIKTFGFTALELKNIYSFSELKRVGYTVNDFRKAGFSVEFLLENGYNEQQLKTNNFTPIDFKNAGYTITQILNLGFSISDLNIGFTKTEWTTAGYNQQNLKNAGFPLIDLINIGYTTVELKNLGYKKVDWGNANITFIRLKQDGYTANDLLNIGFTLLDVLFAGYTAEELKSFGITAVDLKLANISLSQLLSFRFTLSDLNIGYSKSDWDFVNISPIRLKNEGLFSLKNLLDAGYTINELNIGFPKSDWLAQNITPSILKENGFTITNLRSIGFTLIDLNLPYSTPGSVFTRQEWYAAFYDVEKLKTQGNFSIADLFNAGFSLSELNVTIDYTKQQFTQNNITVPQLKSANFTITDLIGSGYSLSDLNIQYTVPGTVFTKQQWSTAGYFPTNLKNTGLFTLENLFNAGYSLEDLNIPFNQTSSGYLKSDWTQLFVTPIQLKNAGFSALDLLNAQFTLADINIGYTKENMIDANIYPTQLKSAGYTIDILLSMDYTLSDINIGFTRDEWINSANWEKGNMNINILKLRQEGLFSLQNLIDAGFTDATELKTALFTPIDLKLKNYTIDQLLNALYLISELNIGYSASEWKASNRWGTTLTTTILKINNFTLQDLVNSQFPYSDLNIGFFKNDWISIVNNNNQLLNVTTTDLKQAGFSVDNLLDANYDISELNIDFTSTEWKASRRWNTTLSTTILKNNNFTLQDLINSGFLYSELNIGFTKFDWSNLFDQNNDPILITSTILKNSDFTIDDLYNAGYSLSDIKSANFTKLEWTSSTNWSNGNINIYKLRYNGGYTLDELITLGFTDVSQLKSAEFTTSELKSKNYTIDQLLIGGYLLRELNIGFTRNEWINSNNWNNSNITIIRLRQEGLFSLQNLIDAGFTDATELKTALFTPTDLKLKNYTIDQLLNALYLISELNIGYSASEWKSSNRWGTTLTTTILKINNFTLQDLVNSQFPYSDLNIGFFKNDWNNLLDLVVTTSDLKQANFSIDNLLDANYDISELNVGFSSTEWKSSTRWENTLSTTILKNNNFTLQDLINSGFLYSELNIGFIKFDWSNLFDQNNDPILITTTILKNSNFTIDDLYNAGYSLSDIKSANFSKLEWTSSNNWNNSNINIYKLRYDGGYTLEELITLGFTDVAELKNAEFTSSELKSKNYTIDQLLSGGYLVRDLNIGYLASEWKLSIRWGNTLTTTILKNSNFTLQNLITIGFEYNELNIGFSKFDWNNLVDNNNQPILVTILDLKQAGFTIDNFISSNFLISDLVGFFNKTEWISSSISTTLMFNANITITQFINMEFDLHDIKNLGFIKSEWITTGYTATSLKTAGFTIDDLLFNGFNIIDLNIGFTVFEWKSSSRWGSTLTNLVLKESGYTLQDQINIGFTYAEANVGYDRDQWFNLVDLNGNIISLTPEELKSIGFTIDDLYNIGFELSEIKPLNFSKNEWINSTNWKNNKINLYSLWSIGNFSFTELFNLGFNTLLEYKNANFTPNDLNTVYTIDQLLEGGYSILSLVTAFNVSAWKESTRWGTTLTNLILKESGYTLENQLNIGFTISELNIGYLRNEWFANSVTTYQLKESGYTINDLLIKSQFTLSDLNIQFTQTIIGFLKTEWNSADITLTQLRLAGYELANIKAAGYTRREVRDAGYSIQDIDIYYPPSLVRLNTQQYMSSESPYVTLNTGGGTSLDDSIVGSLGGNLQGGTTRYLYFEVKQAGDLYYYIIPNTTDSSPGITPPRFNDYGQLSINNTKLGPKIGGNMLGTGINGSFAQGVKNNVSVGDILELVYIKDNFISTDGDKVDILELYIVPI